ncbi:exported protein of unknown function [Modestobacter italicus]|uniref:Uncharacterized protein n=1 Tax=Modestobacter italicus (strain DSM 44449 / CECT 9708 / BC 501) TaxID=2732864 RepID=I4F266_MODI5|nr:exported protein of unknown function [Modestobacter marinus]
MLPERGRVEPLPRAGARFDVDARAGMRQTVIRSGAPAAHLVPRVRRGLSRDPGWSGQLRSGP